ncbi:hypothetical protein BJX99DRAFT_266723 [Aspergillus californicus]
MPPTTDTQAETGVTRQFCSWVRQLELDDIPSHIQERAKYLILDGIGCAIVAAHLPWTEKATNIVLGMESPGPCPVWGYNKKVGPLPAALLNSTQIQGFEIDDWHSRAPLHSNAIVLPVLFAAAANGKAKGTTTTGKSLLLATIAGYETGPRVGLCLHGSDMLSRGWHSGVVFGHAAAAAAAGKLLNLQTSEIEDAIGISCTQACGLMSAQFSSDAKRMQHGFAARNGLFGALLAAGGYTGIKNVFDEPYGGFLTMFSQGSDNDPQFLEQELQEHPNKLRDLSTISKITFDMSESAHKHGGWLARRPLTATGAQMSCAYVAAVQLIDGEVQPQQFHDDALDRDAIWELVEKTECRQTDEFNAIFSQRATIAFKDGTEITKQLNASKGVDPALSNEEIVGKYRRFTKGLISDERQEAIEEAVLGLDNVDDISTLEDLLVDDIASPFNNGG